MDLNQFSTVDIVLDKANDNIIQRQTISAGDRDGRSLTLQVTDAGSIGEVPGLTANLLWTNHSSGVSDLSAFSVVDRTTSVFRFIYPQNMLTAGKVTAQIQLLHNGKVTHSKKFEIIVLDIAGKLKGVLQTAEYTTLVEALAKTNGFEGDIRNLELKKATNDALNITNNSVNSLQNSKVDKGGNEQVTWAMASQDFKEQVTGGNTAVVDTNSVNTSNVVDKAITDSKTSLKLLGQNLFSWGTVNKNIIFLEETNVTKLVIRDSDLWLRLSGDKQLDFNRTGCTATLAEGVFNALEKTYTFTFDGNKLLVYNTHDNSITQKNNYGEVVGGDIVLAGIRNKVLYDGVLKSVIDNNTLDRISKNFNSYATWTDPDVKITDYPAENKLDAIIEFKARVELFLPNGRVLLFNANGPYDFTIDEVNLSSGVYKFTVKHNKTLVYDVQSNAILHADSYHTLKKEQILLASASGGALTGGLFNKIILDKKISEIEKNIKQSGNVDDIATTTISTINYSDVTSAEYRSLKYNTSYLLTKIPRIGLDGNIYSPQVGFKGPELNSGLEKPSDFAKRENCLLTINGGTYFTDINKTGGMFIKDGVVLQEYENLKDWQSSILGFKSDGLLKAYDFGTPSSVLLADGVVNALTAFVPIIDNHEICSDEILSKCEHWNQSHPRQIICQLDNKDILFFTCDGRLPSEKGLTLKEAADVLMKYNVRFAYNLDGGGSNSVVVKNKKINRDIDPSERAVVNFIYFK